MINFSKHNLSLRREHFIRSFKQQQQQLIKAKFRYQMECSVINPLAEVWRLKEALAQYNIQYYSKEILQIINSIRPYLNDLQFLRELKSSRLLQDLFILIIGQLKLKPYLQAPLLTEIIVQLAAELLKRTQFFVKTLEEHLSYLLFSVYKYPFNNKILEKVTNCINLLQPNFSCKSSCQSTWLINLCQQGLLIERLIEIYLLRESYETSCGLLQFVELSQKGDQRWFRNAVNVLQIVNSLLPSLGEKQKVLKQNSVKKGIIEGLRTYINRKKQTQPFIQEQSTQSQNFGESLVHNPFQQCISYFICVLLDIFLLREELVNEQQEALLKSILSILLQEIKKGALSRIAAAKIIKILYEQVILDQNDLEQISSRYDQLSGFIQTTINSDCV